MKKRLLPLLFFLAFGVITFAQNVTIDIQESDNGCGLATDCENNVACFDLIITINQPNWELASYNIWTQYPKPATMSYASDNACITQNGGDTDDNFNGQYRVAGINGVTLLQPNVPTIFHTICYDYQDEDLIRDSVIAVGGKLSVYGFPFNTTVTLSHTITGATAGLTINTQEYLNINSNTLSCLVPDLLIEKELTSYVDNDGSGTISFGDVLTYTITTTNTGNITQTNVVVSDPKLNPASTTCATLPVGAQCILTGTYIVTQPDVNAGQIVNTATVESNEAGPYDASITTPIGQQPDMTINKTLLTNVTGGIVVGQSLVYKVEVTNTGNTTLNNVAVSDVKLTPQLAFCAAVLPGQTCTLTGAYLVTQADIDAGEIVNTANAISDETPPATTGLTTPVPQYPSITTVKTLLTDVSGGIAVGDVLSYSVKVTNTGNTTLHNVTASDLMLIPHTKTCAALAPAGSCILTGTYVVQQADIDAGQIVNTGTGDSDETDPVTSQVTTTIVQEPGMIITKTLITDISAGVMAGNVLTYTVEITNTGNITLNNVVVADNKITPASATCASVAPGATCSLTGSHTLTQVDIDAGEIGNTGTGDSDETDPVTKIITTPLPQTPELTVVKSAAESTYTAIGDEINYTITVTNTGNVTIDNIEITDANADAGSISCSGASLLPGEFLICTAIHTVDTDDMLAGEVVNIAYAAGDDPLDNSLTFESNEVVVTVKILIANDDTGTPINGYNGGVSVPNVLVNDLLNGVAVDPLEITLSQISTTNAGVTLDPLTSAVNVTPGTPAGNYELVYQICEILNPTNCDQATVFVTVEAPEILAVDDNGTPINGYDGGESVPNVLVNDLLNGVAVDPLEITLTQISTTNPGVTLDPLTGAVNVTPGTPAGNYELVYQICEILNSSNCDQATAYIPVTAPEILAVDDNGVPINGYAGGESVPNVLVNDLLNGVAVDPLEITLTQISTTNPGVTLDPVTGAVNVAPGTPAGNYELVYEICEILNPTNCDQATVFVPVTAPEILAVDDNGTPINGYNGGESVPNVLVNDLLNGVAVDPLEITLAQISTTNAGVTLDPLTSAVNVAPGTPAGNYELVYEICEILNPTNCDQATVFVPVTAPEILAVDDTGTPINGYNGGVSVPNVLTNDLLNGIAVDPLEITLSQISTTNAGVTLDPLTSAVNVAPGTPAGNYELVYEICEILNPTNCDQATVFVPVTAPEILAVDDNGVSINGYNGGESVPNVLVNDLLNGVAVDPLEITLTQISTTNAGVTLDPLTGAVNVTPGTPAGNYELVYQICEILNPTNCDQATVFVTVEAPEILAVDDNGTPVNGYNGGESVPNVLANDLLNGVPVNPAEITLAQISTTHPGVMLDPLTGAVNVAPGTSAGNYELVYQICEILNPTNCDQATVFVTVEAPEILAVDDNGVPINGYAGGESVPNVLANDLLNGVPVNPAEITLAQISTTHPGVMLDPLTSAVNVAPGTPAGNYELVYEICEILNPTNCDQATVYVEVTFSTIVANDDTGTPVNGYNGGESVPNVLANDLLNGVPVNPAEITLTQISTTNPGVTLDPLTSAVNVAPGTPAGNYELVYEICEILNPTNCDQATVFVPVTAPEILAVDDNGVPINGYAGGESVPNVLVNDLLNGVAVDPLEITLAQISTTHPDVTLDPLTGAVNVTPGTPAGNYELVYQICEILNPTNCDQATVFVPVTAPEILAVDDNGTPVNGYNGGESVPNVLVNDLLNGASVNSAEIMLSQISTTNPGVTLDPLTGSVNVAPGTPAGNYELVYQICEILNSSNCDQATVFVPVTAPEILAVDDTGTPINGYNGGVSVPNVLTNDLLNGVAVDPLEITLTQISTTNPDVTLDPLTGAVNVAPGTSAGNYELVYQICEILNSSNCDQATVFIPVTAPEILAVDDTGTPINGYNGGVSVPNVLTNDSLNGVAVDPLEITLAQISTTNPGITLDPLTGAVNVAPGTPAGNYELVYQICEILNSSNCDQATVFVPVTAPEILAVDDTGTPINGYNGGVSVPNVLTNDSLNGVAVDPLEITLAQISTTNPGITLDPLTGAVNVAPGTPAGNYELVYQICEILNSSNCDQATVFVPVTAPEILAVDDTGTPINGYNGGVSVPNVLTNDSLNGVAVDPLEITLAQISTTNPGITLDPLTGAVNVAPGTPAGNYELVYEICEILNPSNCDQATAYIPVTAPEILAVDDNGVPINGYAGGESVPNVLTNDLLNGVAVDQLEITLTQISTSNPGVTLDPLTGSVNVAPGTPAGDYELVYEICEIVNTTNCDQATAFVPVTAPEILAVNDNGVSINGYVGGESVPNVLVNDLLNGVSVNSAEIMLSQISTTNPGVTLDPLTGSVNVALGTPAGNYELVYQICEILNSSNCDQATVFVPVTAPEILAVDDNGTPINGYNGGVSVPNVLTNDLLNGVAVDPLEITLTQISTTNPGVTLDPVTGAVNVAPGTSAGNYELVYQICEILNSSNCDQATVFVPVTAPEILAVDDNGVLINGVLGGVSVANVLANDLLNGALVNPALITLSQISTTNPGVTLDPLTGAVNVALGTPTGTYYVEYEICEILNPGNCDQALVTVPVFQEPTVTFCINDEEAQSSGQYAYCSTEPVALTLCGIDAGVAPFDICYEINGTPDCVYDIALDDVIFNQLFAAGVYDVTILSITDDAGYSVVDLSSYHFQFTISTGATAFAGNNAAICQGSPFELSLATAQNAGSFVWMGGDGTFTPSANVVNPVYTPGPLDILAGSVELCLTAQSELPCTLEAVDCMTLTILQPPSVVAGADIVACQSDGFVMLNGVVNYAASTDWSSTGFDGFFADPDEPATMYFFGEDDISNGGATLCLTATAIYPCLGEVTDCLTLTIIADPTANAGPDAVICEGDNYLLSEASVTDAGDIEWETYGDGTFDNLTLLNPVYTPGPVDIANGTVQLCINAEAAQNCGTSAIDCMILTIAKLPQANPGGDLSLSCSDYDIPNGKWLPVELSNTITGDYDAVLWTTDGDGTFSDSTAVAPLYYPGLADIWKGDIELCVTVQSVEVCQTSDTKCMMLYIPQQLIYFDVDGWWGISSYLDTDLPLVKQVMDPLVLIPGSQHLVTMLDKQGKYFWAEPVPTQATLGNWMPIGYKAKIKNPPACLPIYGDSLLNQTFTVSGAFTFLPVLTNVPVAIDELLAGHLNDILLIYDWASKVLWTPQAADFTKLYPGRAYLMVNQTAIGSYTIQYPDFVPDAPHLYPVTPPKSAVIHNSPWQQESNTAIPHIMLFADKAMSKLANGDILAVFDSQGNCYGQTEYGTEGVFSLIAMGRNEQLRDERTGFEASEKMFVRRYNAATGVQQAVTFVYDTDFPSSDGLFAANGASHVVDIIETATNVNDLSGNDNVTIYPNPASSELNIKAGSNIQKVELLSSTGQIIMRQSCDATQVRLDVSQYKAGVYFVAITQSTGEVITRRVTIF